MKSNQCLGLAAFTLVAGTAWGDYAPLKTGNVWRYAGRYQLSEYANSQSGGSNEAREALRLEVLSKTVSGDTSFYRVALRDSLYARTGTGRYAPTGDGFRDTVLKQVRTFASVGDRVFMVPIAAEKDSGVSPDTGFVRPGPFSRPYSLFSQLQLLIAHRQLPGAPQAVPGAAPALAMMETQPPFDAGSFSGSWKGWYADGVGGYWAQVRIGQGAACGPYMNRVLELVDFNGRKIDPGIDPPASPLAKEGRAACSLVKRGTLSAGRIRVAGRNAVDAAGRVRP